MNPEEIRQKLIANTPLTPEEISVITQALETKNTLFQWYVDDLKGWKEMSLTLLDQNRTLTLLCQMFIREGKKPA